MTPPDAGVCEHGCNPAAAGADRPAVSGPDRLHTSQRAVKPRPKKRKQKPSAPKVRVVDPASPWLTTEEGARYGKCGPKTLYHEVAAGRLRAAKVGGKGRLLFRREWIDEWHLRNATPIEVTR